MTEAVVKIGGGFDLHHAFAGTGQDVTEAGILFPDGSEGREVRDLAQIGKNGKALQQTAALTKPGVKNMGGYPGTGSKETLRRGSNAIKGITVQVNEREHRELLCSEDYESVCGMGGKGYRTARKRCGENTAKKERKAWTNPQKESIL